MAGSKTLQGSTARHKPGTGKGRGRGMVEPQPQGATPEAIKSDRSNSVSGPQDAVAARKSESFRQSRVKPGMNSDKI